MNALVEQARLIALRHELDPAKVCGLIEVESEWNPWAARYEPGFFNKYLDNSRMHLDVKGFVKAAPFAISFDTELRERAFSRGLMQIMGQVARERGFTGPLAQLHDPETGIEYGCLQLRWLLPRVAGVYRLALIRYNGGADSTYPDRVMAASARYQ